MAADATTVTLARRASIGYALFCASRVLESLALGWLACACTLTCALASPRIVSAADGVSAQAWAASAIAGLCAALAWWIEHAPERASFVRRVDVHSGEQGALVTAVEAARDDERGPLAGLLVARVAARVPGRAWARAAAPHAIAVLAVPLLGLALALAAIDASSVAPETHGLVLESDARALATAARSLRAALERVPTASQSKRDVSSPLRDAAVVDAAGRLEAAAQAIARGDADPRQLHEDLARLEQDLAASAAAVDPRSETGAAIASALEAASASRFALEAAGAEIARPGSLPGAGAPPPFSGSSPAVPSAGSAGAAQARVAGSAPDGRMSAPVSPTAGATASDAQGSTSVSVASTGAEGGLANSRWWASSYDEVVERWVEARRSARER